MNTGKTSTRKAFKLAEAFVVANKGQWDHHAWEAFIDQATEEGVLGESDEVKRNLGNMLECGKFFYQQGESQHRT